MFRVASSILGYQSENKITNFKWARKKKVKNSKAKTKFG